MNIYIAGPMRGKPFLNFPAFDAAAQQLLAQGYNVVNPADIDRENGFEPVEDPDESLRRVMSKWSIRDIATRDLVQLIRCDGVMLLPGWQESAGARAELAVAQWVGLQIGESK